MPRGSAATSLSRRSRMAEKSRARMICQRDLLRAGLLDDGRQDVLVSEVIEQYLQESACARHPTTSPGGAHPAELRGARRPDHHGQPATGRR